ncbi:MAG: dihydrofolate reductase [Chloroflexi bacterium]|jgi:dihydrofolate reductase|nr:dihydrofolate reductase [Chloroflexota bacterium]
MKTKISVYIATSLDGFIARADGGMDWLEHDAGDDDYGFAEFMASVDTVVMGRLTYEFVVSTGLWPYEGKRMVVMSSTLGADDAAPHLAGKVEFLAMEPLELAAKLAGEGAKHVYIDGGLTIQRFLRERLIDELILSRMPVLLGSGVPLFGELDRDVLLRHVETQGFASGLVQSRYAAVR